MVRGPIIPSQKAVENARRHRGRMTGRLIAIRGSEGGAKQPGQSQMEQKTRACRGQASDPGHWHAHALLLHRAREHETR